MQLKANSNGFRQCNEAGIEFTPPHDVCIATSDGQSIAAHSSVLASESPVLERKIDRARRGWNSDCTTIRILGVSSDAIIAFLQFLYSSRTTTLSVREIEDAMEKHSMHLLALSHANRVPWLKLISETAVAARLTAENVVDTLKISKMCDAPRLYLQCMQLMVKDFASVQKSDGWQFIRRRDPALELEILQFLEDTDQRKKRWKLQRAAQETYKKLSEAMDCLQHIFTEGCTEVGPTGEACAGSHTCQGLKLLMRHFATCGKRLARGGCLHCKRMWQLLRLHSCICDFSELCKVPFCSQFKVRMQKEKIDKTWRLLVKKVARAKVMRYLASRKRPEQVLRYL